MTNKKLKGLEYGKIYKLVDNTNGNIYIGSTEYKDLNDRLLKHKQRYRDFITANNSYIASLEIINNGDYYIELLENYPCNSKLELRTKEQEYMDKYRNAKLLNIQNAVSKNK